MKTLGDDTPAQITHLLCVTSMYHGRGSATRETCDYNSPSCRRGKKRAALLVLTPSFVKQLKEQLLLLCSWNNAGCLQKVYRAVGDKTWKPVYQSFPAAERGPEAWTHHLQ